ncbi:hypothetical protein [Methanosarcina sp. WWM596]|uniref:hypothetical protein n=1 Tax=Methanosarcina sp. WWM596 TaxID=1434103 RepID=UPI0006160D26|nr:hypothetical protein [Methanosarcina sp. WWM596]AKB19606.1 Two component system histidine kinase [Methanosarcina sp. WWM596]AKB22642.1 Two component system histidine kinase [Methanosarcina sp. WH1]
MLDISRLELGNIELYYETADIPGVIEEIQRVLSSLVTEKSHKSFTVPVQPRN